MKNGPLGLAGVIAAAFLLLHLPFLPASLEDIDSINFAMGVRHFDVAEHQPHPPGYPLYILAAKAVHAVVPSEVHALSLLGVLSGTLAIVALAALFRRLEAGPRSEEWSLLATGLSASAPLFWFTAARPLSDMPGLAAALGIQALTLSASTAGRLALAAFLAGLGGGIRSQVIWLTVPLVVVMAAKRPRADRLEDSLVALGALIMGGLVWFVPLVWVSGGPLGYWRALSFQGSADLTGVAMLWTTHTSRQFLLAFTSTFIAPWATPALAAVIIALALAGALRMVFVSRQALWLVVAAYLPYLVFDLLFQENVTTRYALPVIVPLSYLAARGAAWLPRRSGAGTVIAVAAVSLAIAVPSLQAYASVEAPAFQMLTDMRAASPTLGAPPVFATHRRGAVDLRRPMAWVADTMPAFSQRLPATPKHEWMDLVNYWNIGGRAPVWFVADPQRSDLALIDHPTAHAYRWSVPFPLLLGGVRPSEMDWYVIEWPGWYLGEGWALTPETAGVATADGRGPTKGPIPGWIRRRAAPITLMIGGRNFAPDRTAAIQLTIDGRSIGSLSAPPGFFLRTTTVAAEALAGPGDYALLNVAAEGDVAIEQFDAQPADKVVFGYGDGWNEMEYDSQTGRTWRWMSERGALRLRGTGEPLVLSLAGVTETFSRRSRVTVRVGDRVVTQQDAGATFSIRAILPADLVGRSEQVITIETDQVYVPAERSARSSDRRHLGLKVFQLSLAR